MLNINPITKVNLDATLRNIADEVDRSVARWARFSTYLLSLSDADLTTLGYDETSRQFISAFRVALLNMQEAYMNVTKTGSSDPSYVVKQFASPVIF